MLASLTVLRLYSGFLLSPYFDNAATSHPKPEQVYQASSEALRKGGSPGRGAHRVALDAGRLQFDGRSNIAKYLGIKDSSRLIFTSGCTAAINLVLNGLVAAGRLQAGTTVLVSSFEHNAVMRPLTAIALQLNLNIVTVPPLPSGLLPGQSGAMVDLKLLAELLDLHKPALCVFTRASNVTGEVLDLESISSFLADRGIPLLVDAAQSAGYVLESLSSNSAVSFWVTSGHKGLLGPSGIGLLYLKEGEELGLTNYGGTGSNSNSFDMPDALPDRFEPGTAAPHLVSGLTAGVNFAAAQAGALHQNQESLTLKLLQRLADLDKKKGLGSIELPGRPTWLFKASEGERLKSCKHFLPVFSLSFAKLGITPDRVAQKLDHDFDIATRPGLHCALLAHQTLGTTEQGLLRVSFGAFTTAGEVDSLIDGLTRIL